MRQPPDLSRWADLVDRLAPSLLGREDATGDALAERVAALSQIYTRDRESSPTRRRGEANRPGAEESLSSRSSTASLLAARLRFFFIRDLPKIRGPLEELHSVHALPSRRTWSILDLGAGVGTTTLGAAAFAAEHDLADRLDVVALDREPEPLRLFSALAAHGAELDLPQIALKTLVGDFGRAVPPGEFDLIFLGFALNEWAGKREPADVAARLETLGRALAPDGSMVVLEPALRAPSRFLHAVRDALVARARLPVFAPCLHRARCPMLANERDWCHEDRPARLPDALIPVARGAGLRYERATYAYLALRRDGGSLASRVDSGTPYRVVSQPMRSKGKLELFLCGDGVRARAMRLDRHASDENAAFEGALRGDVLSVADAKKSDQGEGATLRIGPTTRVV